jgi:hypothetical protein
MAQANLSRQTIAKVVDFDEALFDACPPQVQAELLEEAALLADAFATGGDAADLARIAEALANGSTDLDMGRMRARRLSTAIRRLAAGGRT